MLFGCAALGAAAGNLWVTVTDLVDADALRVVGDLLLLVSLMLVVVALAIYPSGPRRPIDLFRVVLDGVVLAGSILLILSNTLIPRIAEQPSAESFAVALAPVIDIVLVTVAWLMFLRSTRRDRPALALAAAGFALFAISDISATVRRSEDGFTFGTVVDLGWIAGYTVLAIAVRWSPSAEETQQPERPHRSVADRRHPVDVRGLLRGRVAHPVRRVRRWRQHHGGDPAGRCADRDHGPSGAACWSTTTGSGRAWSSA